MKLTTLLAAAAFTASTSIASAACSFHESAQISCAQGTVYDDKTETCVPATTS